MNSPLPNFMYRRLAMPGGGRFDKLVPLEKKVVGFGRYSTAKDRNCSKCGKEVYSFYMNGHESLQGIYRAGEYFHDSCAPPGAWRDDKIVVTAGNLGCEEYRFYVGVDQPEARTNFAICRACKASCYGRLQRLAHSKDDGFAVGGDRCAKRLEKAYKTLMERSNCLMCGQDRKYYAKWGVPLCQAAKCEREWKYSQTRHIALDVILDMQKLAAREAKK